MVSLTSVLMQGRFADCPTGMIGDLLFLYESVNDNFLFLYPTAWAIVLVRKIVFT